MLEADLSWLEGWCSGQPSSKRMQILATAGRLFHEKGFEATSIQDVAAACGLTKPGLYHHIRSKEDLLLEICMRGLDVFEAEVVVPALAVADPLERLRIWMDRHVRLVHRPSVQQVTVLIHERTRFPGPAENQIRNRKRRLMQILETAFRDAMEAGQIRPVHPKVAAFSMVGMVLWTSRWYRPEGELDRDDLAREIGRLFFGGLVSAAAVEALPPRAEVLTTTLGRNRPTRRRPGLRTPAVA